MLSMKSGLVFLRQGLLSHEVASHEQPTEEILLPDWHLKVTSLVNLKITESQKKQKEIKEAVSPKEQIEKLVMKELKKEVESYERQGYWNCPYCDKVEVPLIRSSWARSSS